MNQNGDILPSDGTVSVHINGCAQKKLENAPAQVLTQLRH